MKNSKKTILLLEDNQDILEAVQFLLEDAGYNVVAIEDERLLMNAVKRKSPDLILMDMLLSGIDGRDIISSLKRQKQTKRIPIILTSAHPNGKNMWKESGANDFLAKPFSIEILQAVILRNL